MRSKLMVLGVIAAASSLVMAGAVSTSASAGATGDVALVGSHSAFAVAANVRGHVEGSRYVTFDVILAQRNQAQLRAMITAVSDPASPTYHHYLTAAQYLQEFAPTAATVQAVQTWLRSQGFTIGHVPTNRTFVEAAGTAAQAERAFQTTIDDYVVKGKPARAAAGDLSIPASLAGSISGVSGIDDTSAFVQPDIARENATTTPAVATPVTAASAAIAPPPGFINAPPCSAGWGSLKATGLPAYAGYPNPLPYVPCGYTPAQLRKAYGMDAAIAAGTDGTGQTVAIVDAYLSPTLVPDTNTYAALNDPAHPLGRRLTVYRAPSFSHTAECDAPGWSGEQSLDVEAVHSLAPNAHIVYVGAASCYNKDLNDAINYIVENHLAQVISNSYGSPGEIDTPGDLAAYDTIFSDAILTGIEVNFSSGDTGDEYTLFGYATPDLPASHPLVTAVGGTSLGLRTDGSRVFATGWQTGKSTLVGGAWVPGPPGSYLYGSGGGTSRLYAQPGYQAGVVPDALAKADGGPGKGRVVPDVAALGDPTTGMLIGITQTFADGTYYNQYKIGGTSLASPLFTAMMALADQAAGYHHGFVNPVLYQLAGRPALLDTRPLPSPLAAVRVSYSNPSDPTSPTVTSVRTIDRDGTETYTSPTGVTTTVPDSLEETPGYDNITGLGEPNGQAFLHALS